MAFQRSDVVLVPFPFTDLSAKRARPAVVVSVPEYERTTGDGHCSANHQKIPFAPN
jgi:mRNA-degrading endonuclease toxin of MazEF toxin-antitoxin module